MKNIYSITAILFLALLSMNFVSGRADYPSIKIIFKPSTGVDMDKLETYCTPDTCSILDYPSLKYIAFRLDYKENKFDVITHEYKDKSYTTLQVSFIESQIDNNPDYLKETTKLGLNLLKSSGVINGVTKEDIERIAELTEINQAIYFNPPSCNGNGWEKASSPEGESCGFKKYEGTCPIIECTKILNCPDNFVLGELGVIFKKTITEDSARELVRNWGLNVSETNVSNWGERLDVKVPEGQESQWMEILKTKEEVAYVNRNYCVAPGSTMDSSINFESLSYLNLQKKPNITYWILGIAVIVVIIAFLFLVFKKKK